MDWSPGVAGFDGSPRRAAQSVTAALADFLQVEQVEFSRVVHQIPHLHTLMPSHRDGNGVRWTSVDTGSFQSAQIDSLERLSSRNGKHLKKWLSSRDYCRMSPPRIVPQLALRREWRLGVSWRWVAVAKQRFLHHCGGGVSPASRTVGGGVEVAVAVVVVVIVVRGRIALSTSPSLSPLSTWVPSLAPLERWASRPFLRR